MAFTKYDPSNMKTKIDEIQKGLTSIEKDLEAITLNMDNISINTVWNTSSNSKYIKLREYIKECAEIIRTKNENIKEFLENVQIVNSDDDVIDMNVFHTID